MITDLRLAALRRFAVAITILNIAGHAFLGFEQSLLQVFVSLATAYSVEILIEIVDSRANRRGPRFQGGPTAFVDFLLPGHITGLAVAMLLYANEQILPIVFAATVAVGSKAVFRTSAGNSRRHFFNPSNAGIALTLVLFPWISIAPPYQFTENLGGIAHWILPCIFILTGTLLNVRFTRRLPLIIAWVSGFALQALLRSLLFETALPAGFMPITGVAFLLFTFYMITDPGTTPVKPLHQVLFGAGVAFAYAVLLMLHVAFGLFFALAIVCALRGLGLYVLAVVRGRRAMKVPASEPAAVVLRAAES